MWRISILALGGLGSVAFLLVGATGYLLRGIGDDDMPRHVVGAVVALLFLVFALSWLTLFLWSSRRAVTLSVRAHALSDDFRLAAKKLNGLAVIWTLAAMTLTLAAVVTGGLVYTAAAPLWSHHLSVIGAAVAQGGALWNANSALRRHEKVFDAMESAVLATSERQPG